MTEVFNFDAVSSSGKLRIMFSPGVNLNCCKLFMVSVTVKSSASDDDAFSTPEESFLPFPDHTIPLTVG